jgi:hypothetical protein
VRVVAEDRRLGPHSSRAMTRTSDRRLCIFLGRTRSRCVASSASGPGVATLNSSALTSGRDDETVKYDYLGLLHPNGWMIMPKVLKFVDPRRLQ